MFSNHFDVLIIKNKFKKIKKFYSDIFSSKNTLKNNHYYIHKHPLNNYYLKCIQITI